MEHLEDPTQLQSLTWADPVTVIDVQDGRKNQPKVEPSRRRLADDWCASELLLESFEMGVAAPLFGGMLENCCENPFPTPTSAKGSDNDRGRSRDRLPPPPSAAVLKSKDDCWDMEGAVTAPLLLVCGGKAV